MIKFEKHLKYFSYNFFYIYMYTRYINFNRVYRVFITLNQIEEIGAWTFRSIVYYLNANLITLL